jgi:hypothetical protein
MLKTMEGRLTDDVDIKDAKEALGVIRTLQNTISKVDPNSRDARQMGKELKQMARKARRCRLRIEWHLSNPGFHCAQDRLHVQLLMQIEEKLRSGKKVAN